MPSPADSNSPTAWFNGRWVPSESLALPLDDLGVLQGVVVVDRLRSCGGRLVDLSRHVDRVLAGCQELRIDASAFPNLHEVIQEVHHNNRTAYRNEDSAIVLVITPGRLGGSSPTIMIHPSRLPWVRIAQWCTHGQALVVTGHRSIPSACWSTQIKTRARLHYYLADGISTDISGRFANGVLLDSRWGITETSTANILIVEGKRLVSPPWDQILHGICLQRTCELAAGLNIEVAFEPISPERAVAADELLLCGSSAFLWPASRLSLPSGGVAEGEITAAEECFSTKCYPATSGEMFQSLKTAWSDFVGVDYIEQAVKAASHGQVT